MFGFMHRSGSRRPSRAIRRALEHDGLPLSIESASMLRVVQTSGRVSDRNVTFIRVFDPVQATERALDVRSFRDLDSQPGLILKAGHIEPDGIVVITRHLPPRDVQVAVPKATDYATSDDGLPAVLRGTDSADRRGPA